MAISPAKFENILLVWDFENSEKKRKKEKKKREEEKGGRGSSPMMERAGKEGEGPGDNETQRNKGEILFRTGGEGSESSIRKFRACVFDCDGVIFDSNNLKTKAYEDTLASMGIPEQYRAQFIEAHLADVSVSRYVKFSNFFSREDARAASSTPSKAVEEFVATALEMYGRNCSTLYAGLQPQDGAIRMAHLAPKAWVISGGSQDELRRIFLKRASIRTLSASAVHRAKSRII